MTIQNMNSENYFILNGNDHFNSLFKGDVVKVPNVPSQSMAQAKEQFCIVGRIITHDFPLNKKILCNVAKPPLQWRSMVRML